MTRFGFVRYVDFTSESEHVAIGRDGWAPLAYAIASQHLGYGASGALCRYLDLAGAVDGVSTLEDWGSGDKNVKSSQMTHLAEDQVLFEGLLCGTRTGARTELAKVFFALKPPHQGVVLCCSEEYVKWHKLPQHSAYYNMLLARYDWLQEQVSEELQGRGFEVEGPLFKMDGFKARYYDNWDVFAF